jgi:hypothetical protein
MLGINGVKAAEKEIIRLRDARSKIEERFERARVELEEIRTRQPEVDLEAILNDQELPWNAGRNRAIILKAEVEGAQGTLASLVRKLRDAISVWHRAKAEEVRKQAVKVDAELSKHRTTCDGLLSHLQELEGVPFQAIIFPIGPLGTGEGSVPFTASKTMKLQQELAKLLAEASALESKQPEGIAIDAEDLDQLIEKIHASDLGMIPPSIAVVRTWFTTAFQEARADFNRADYGSDFPSLQSLPVEMSVILCSNVDGEILPSSTVRLRLAPISRQVAMETFGAQYQRELAAD